MHFEFLPKPDEHKETTREFRREENRRIGRLVIRSAPFVIVIALILWWLWH